MSLNGSTVQLVKEHGDDNGEYWVVTTVDGTKYYFRRSQLPG